MKLNKVKFKVENKEQYDALMKRLEELGYMFFSGKQPTKVEEIGYKGLKISEVRELYNKMSNL